MRFIFLCCCLLVVGLGSDAVAGIQAPRVEGKRLAAPPRIDGTVDEAEWSAAAGFEGMRYSDDGSPAAERARFWLGYDDDFIYFAAKLYDPQPGTIRATEYRTNVNMPGDDQIDLKIDLSGSLNDFNSFEINPRGATNIELAGGRAAKREWTGEFVAKSRITSEGWETEARIPWQAMSIPAGGRRDVRFNIDRDLPRISREAEFGYTNDGARAADTPVWAGVELPKPVVDRSIKLLPYVYAGYDEDEKTVFNSGLDLKTQIADQATLVGTINPDFRNIENDILSLDFSRFERIADESRPFFLEGSEYLSSGIFASQRIESFDVGVNAYGKLGDRLQFGLLDTLDFGHENAFATTVSYDPSPLWSYRLAATSLSRENYDNSAYLLRARRQFGSWGASIRTLGSQDTEIGFGQNHEVNLEYGNSGTFGWLGYDYLEKNFNPALGYFPERDYKGFNGGVAFSRPSTRGPIQRHGFEVFARDLDRTDGTPYREQLSLESFLILRNQLFFRADADLETFEGQKDRVFGASIGYPNNDPYRRQAISVSKGTIGGEDYELYGYGGNFRPFRGFQVSLSHQRFKLDETIEQSIFGLSYDLGNDRSVSGRAVRFQDSVNWYLAFRQSGNRGAEYYLIVGDPNAREFRQSVILKAVLPFQLGSSRPVAGARRQLSP